MALSDAFLDDLKSRVTLSEIVGRRVTWDKGKSNPSRGDFWAPCPFHQEKTASFHAEDRKGRYYCFGCQAKGDAITFLMEIDRLSFMDAVQKLADEAGVEMPRDRHDPQAAAKRDRMTEMADAMETAVRHFRAMLSGAEGRAARDYLARRGLSGETVRQFEIGYAPDAWSALADRFTGAGQADIAVAAGLIGARKSGDGHYDRFRGRVMFPIRDPRGRCIAFGGRALDPEADAKYLNSPETELFHKGNVLFNEGPAAGAARDGTVVVAEGYMDVIALAQAGFRAAVAPLGTAITETQLKRLWRLSPEPIVALDGDKAGLRAADRLIDLCLPALAPGKSVHFALLPDGKDPDDLIRAGGPEAMQRALDAAIPLVDMLWRREVEAGPLNTPEQKADFDQRLRAALGKIGDAGVRGHYAAELRDRRRELFRGAASPSGSAGGGTVPWRKRQSREGPAPSTVRSDLVRGLPPDAVLAERQICALLAGRPEIVPDLEADLDDIVFLDGDAATAKEAILDRSAGDAGNSAGFLERWQDGTALPAPVRFFIGLYASKPSASIVTVLRDMLSMLLTDRGVKVELEELHAEITDRTAVDPDCDAVDAGDWNDRDRTTPRVRAAMAERNRALDEGARQMPQPSAEDRPSRRSLDELLADTRKKSPRSSGNQ